MRKLFEKMFTNYVTLSEAKNLKSITPHPVFSFFAHAQKRKQTSPARGEVKKAAFTLAETLITLGIIGIVAALVIPGVINNFKIKELESRFKKTDAAITKALYGALNELGADVGEYLNDTTTPAFNQAAIAKTHADEINSVWAKQFLGAKIITSPRRQFGSIAKCHDFFGDISIYCGHTPYNPGSTGFILPDGAFIGWVEGVENYQIGTTLTVLIDTNGPNKGPNANGYDIFRYMYNVGVVFWNNCSPLAQDTYSVHGCHRFARIDQNPYDNRVSYWKSLYKPKSWWENVRNNSKK